MTDTPTPEIPVPNTYPHPHTAVYTLLADINSCMLSCYAAPQRISDPWNLGAVILCNVCLLNYAPI